MDYLKDFLTMSQQQSIEGYKYIGENELLNNRMRRGDYVKFMYRYNYKFMEGGIVMDVKDYPVVKLRSYDGSFYNIDLSKTFVFYKRNKERTTKREFFEELLNNLKKK